MYGFRPILTGSVRGRDRADESGTDRRLMRDLRRERTKQARIFHSGHLRPPREIILESDRFVGKPSLCRQRSREVAALMKCRGPRSLRMSPGRKKNKD